MRLVEPRFNGYSGAIRVQETPLTDVEGLRGGMGQPVEDSLLIYVVDDDVSIARLVFLTLESQGYQVKQFHTGWAVLEGLKSDSPDLIILDIVMPGANGVEVAKQVRQSSGVPIIMLSVRDDVTTKLAALEIGADYGNEGDYIRAYVSRLRRKLEPDPQRPRYILLERGFGYRLADPE